MKTLKTAVCVSGQCRSLDRTVKNIQEKLFSRLGDCDVFVYAVDDEDASKAQLLQPKVLVAEKDQPIDESAFHGGWDPTFHGFPFQRYLQQLQGLKRVHQLMETYRLEKREHYDLVLRLRPDAWFDRVAFDPSALDPSAIYLPQWGGFGISKGSGFNDRFAIGGPAAMKTYFHQIDYLAEHVLRFDRRFIAEMATKATVTAFIEKIRFIDVWFKKFQQDHALPPDPDPGWQDWIDYNRWDFAYLGDHRSTREAFIAQAARLLFHLKCQIPGLKRTFR